MLARPHIPFDVHYRPYRLDPNVPRAGVDHASYLAARFGANAGVREAHGAITAQGAGEGIEFAWGAIRKMPNTIDSHRLIRWAGTRGLQDEVVERLFVAYFENGEDIGDIRILADIADICGMDGATVADMLESDTDIALVEREDQLAHEMGVTGVPAMIFGGKIAVSGARDPEMLIMAIDKAAAMTGAQQDEN
jgi:predicted DsbA family dithiol-disulfide isomerase